MEMGGADDIYSHEEDGHQPDGVMEGVARPEMSGGGVRVALVNDVHVDTDIDVGGNVGVDVLFGLDDMSLG